MAKKLFSFILFFSFVFLTACGESGEFVSAFDRTVDDSTSQGSVVADDEDAATREPASEEEDVVEEEPQEGSISLFEKVLANSDVSEVALNNAFEYYDENHENIDNQEWITIFDIGQHSGNRRMYIINMETGYVSAIHTAHGSNSDPDNDGYATKFSNINNSHQSSLGFMLTAETYYGKHGLSLRMDGLEDRNSKVRPRAIVIHGASYVNPNYNQMGRSWGCPAVSDANRDWVINRIKEGSLFYIFHEDHDS